jgi:hypothetical protein
MRPRRALRLLVLSTVLACVASARPAQAGKNDLRLINLCPQAATPALAVQECSWVRRDSNGLIPATGGVVIDSDGRSKFRSLMSELGVVMAPKIPMAADSLGFAGFLLSAELGFTEISRSKSFWDGVAGVSPENPTATRPDPVLTTVGLFLRKGFWLPVPTFELGGGVVNLLDSQMLSWQGYAKLSLHEGFHDLPFPSLSVRAAIAYLTGTDQVSMQTTSFDVMISKGFGLLKTARIEPFGGWSLLLIKASGKTIDFTPLCDAYQVAKAAPGQHLGDHCADAQSGTSNDLGANYGFPGQDAITRYRVFGGAKLKFGVLAIIAQYELYLAGNSRDEGVISAVDQSGRQSAFSLSTGLEF